MGFAGKKGQDIFLKPWRWKRYMLILTCVFAVVNIYFLYSHYTMYGCGHLAKNDYGVVLCGMADDHPKLYLITPTYKRASQEAELVRLSQTLRQVKNLIWLVIEDAEQTSQVIKNILSASGVSFVHLAAPMPLKYKSMKSKPKGVSNRNKGLVWIRENAKDGVLYFADDDNTYHLDLFEEMRYTKKVSMWPVGLVTKEGFSSPVVKNGHFVGFFDGWIGKRKFPVDMAGFAVSVKFLLQRPYAIMPYVAGYEEDGFLKSLAPFEPNEIELKANNCTRILVWHTKTVSYKISNNFNSSVYKGTNVPDLKHRVI